MLINSSLNTNNKIDHVKFISYDGRYPNLCSGQLVLEIDGVICYFGHKCGCCNWEKCQEELKLANHFEEFWSSGGTCGFDSNYDEHVTSGGWKINESALPECYRDYASEIDAVFNDNVPYGCCGGCL